MTLWDLFRGKDHEIKPTLERIKKACNYIGDPQRKYPAIIVGGTNGKGSTCAFLERILREHGFKTGWFVSPHLVSERERWRINGELIEEQTLSDYVRDLRGVFERFELTYFEAAVLIAVRYFADQYIDVAVMEVGMGGRWDAVKVCDPAVILITNVQRDHTRWLGEDIWTIAGEKLALARERVPMVLGTHRFPLYPRALEEVRSDLYVAGYDFTYGGSLSPPKAVLLDYRFLDTEVDEAELGLIGRWQVDNGALAITGARIFTPLKTNRLKLALRKTRWEGRLEILRDNPLIVVDGAHNPDGIRRVMSEIDRIFPGIGVVYSGLEGKEWKRSLEIIRGFRDEIFLVQIRHHRGEDVREIAKEANALGFRSVKILNSSEEVWHLGRDVIVLGSLYLVGEVKSAGPFTVI